MLVMPFDRVTEFKTVQFWNACAGILAALLYVTVRSADPAKAEAPMVVTFSGIVSEVKLVQLEKILAGILVTLLPMVTSFNAVPKRLSLSMPLTLRPKCKVSGATLIKEYVPNASVPPPSAMVNFLMPVQPLKALLPIVATPLGMVMEVKPVQP